jgi:pSer/pThr/pTyr-binding forkhead associated (FHA) protein
MVAILHPVGTGAQIPIDRAVVLIGRSPECDVVLDVSSKISRLHCALVQVDADYYIRDLGSMNGVMVGGQRVEKDRKLTNGAEVMIGDVKYVFLENVAPAVRTARPVSAGRKSPVLFDDSVEVLDVEEVEVIEATAPRKSPVKVSPPPIASPSTIRSPAPRRDGMQQLSPEIIEDIEVVDSEVLEVVEEVELVDDIVDVDELLDEVEVVDDEVDAAIVEIIEDVEVIADAEVIEDAEVIADAEVIEDVQIIEDRPRQRRPPRLR